MNDLLVGLLSTLLATNQPLAISNLIHRSTGVAVPIERAKDPLDQEVKHLMEMDDAARAEIDDLITENERQKALHPELKPLSIEARVQQKLSPVRKAYNDFLTAHPTHARARIAYGSFLSESKEEDEAKNQWLIAKQIAPNEPSVWNNLANYYGHNGPVTNALTHYAKAIELEPRESVYYQNLATTIYLFRKDAADFLKQSIPETLQTAMALYRKAAELDPTNFTLATDLAQSYYGFSPAVTGDPVRDHELKIAHTTEALSAWTNAFKIARDDIERQGVQIHFARLSINASRFEDARRAMQAVNHPMFTNTKSALEKRLHLLESGSTNAPPSAKSSQPIATPEKDKQ